MGKIRPGQLDPGIATEAEVQNDSMVYGASSIGTDAYSITMSPTPTALTTGMRAIFKSDVANTGAATLKIAAALDAKTIKKLGGTTDLADGDIPANAIVEVIFDGTNWEMQTPVANIPTSTEIAALIPTQINVSSAGDTYTDVVGNTYAETANQTRMTLNATRVRSASMCVSGHVSAGTGSFQLFNFTDSASLGVKTTTSVTEVYLTFASSQVTTNNGDDITLRVKNSTAGATVTIDQGGMSDSDYCTSFTAVYYNYGIVFITGYAVGMSIGLMRGLSTGTSTVQLGYLVAVGQQAANMSLLSIGAAFGTAEANTVFTRTGTLKAMGYYTLGLNVSDATGGIIIPMSFQAKMDNI
jgi:hypothetical protein